MENTAKRICHFIWIDSNRDGNTKELCISEYFSLATFRYHHSNWTILLHTNSVLSGELWEKAKNELNIVTVPCSLENMKFKVLHACQFADWYRYRVLYDYGGMYCDLTDSVTIGNFDNIYDTCTLLTRGEAKYGNHFHSGWLCVKGKGSPVCKAMVDLPNTNMYNPTSRAAFEAILWSYWRSPEKSKALPYFVVYPIHFRDMNAAIQKRTIEKEIQPGTKQIHWYASVNAPHLDGQAKMRRDNSSMVTIDNWRECDCAYADAIRIAFGERQVKVKSNGAVQLMFPEHCIGISLAHRGDRRDKLMQQARREDLNLHFLDAQPPIKGAMGWSRGPGEIGCWMSHANAIRCAMMLDWDSVMVIEDDAVLVKDFRVKTQALIDSAPNADVIVVGWNPHVKGRDELLPGHPLYGKPAIPGIWGLTAAIYSKRAYRKILDLWQNQKMAIDIVLSYPNDIDIVWSRTVLAGPGDPNRDSDIQKFKTYR